MADYTVVNLKEVEDQAPNFGLSPQLEARMARVALGLENSGVSYQRLAPNYRVPFGHKHKNQEEIYVLVDGSARIKLEDEVVDRFCVIGPVEQHVAKLRELADAGVDQFNIYLMNGDEEQQLEIYGREVIPELATARAA